MPGTGLLITGIHSTIVERLLPLLPTNCVPYQLRREDCDMSSVAAVDAMSHVIRSAERIVVAHGVLSRKPFLLRLDDELRASLAVNMLSVVRICEIALTHNPRARICVLGSESAAKGSHDVAYWLAKAGLHSYVRERKVGPTQQLVCVAPSMIRGTGMTEMKSQFERDAAVQAHPKKRLLASEEVARAIHFLLFTDMGYITNTVVEMDGGKFAGKG